MTLKSRVLLHEKKLKKIKSKCKMINREGEVINIIIKMIMKKKKNPEIMIMEKEK